MNTEILIHNIAGELASLYVNYLSARSIGASHDYFKANWKSEYDSRVKLMTNEPALIEKLNGYNSFYGVEIKQNDSIKRKFLFQN